MISQSGVRQYCELRHPCAAGALDAMALAQLQEQGIPCFAAFQQNSSARLTEGAQRMRAVECSMPARAHSALRPSVRHAKSVRGACRDAWLSANPL